MVEEEFRVSRRDSLARVDLVSDRVDCDFWEALWGDRSHSNPHFTCLRQDYSWSRPTRDAKSPIVASGWAAPVGACSGLTSSPELGGTSLGRLIQIALQPWANAGATSCAKLFPTNKTSWPANPRSSSARSKTSGWGFPFPNSPSIRIVSKYPSIPSVVISIRWISAGPLVMSPRG